MRHSARPLLSALVLISLLISSPALAAGGSVTQTENEPSLAVVLWTFLESLLPEIDISGGTADSDGRSTIDPNGAAAACDGRWTIDPNG
jgi:hypothetical protein